MTGAQVEARRGYFRALAYRLNVPPMFREDAVQEMMLAVWRREGDRYWRLAARSACIDFLRRVTRFDRRSGLAVTVYHLSHVAERFNGDYDNLSVLADQGAGDVVEEVEARLTVSRIMATARLTERERLILYQRYVHASTYVAIGTMLALSPSRVSQLHEKALRKLRAVA